MSRIWSMMDVGRRSMMNSQTALQTTAHNIANKSTEGYSRQRVDLVSNEPVGEGKMRIGMGAKAGSISRTNNEYIEKQIQREGGELGYLNARSEMLGRVEQVYNEQQTEGLNHSIGAFFNSFRELSSNPESLAARTSVREAASGLTNDFKKVTTQLKDISNDADFRIATKVEQINQITKEIATLNEKIANAELGQSGPANDERDRRDLLLKNLSEKINIRYGESKAGVLTITAGSTAMLVSGFTQRDLKTAPSPAHGSKAEGSLDIVYSSTDGGKIANVTGQMTGGEIGGLLAARDAGVGDLKKNMDKLAFTIANEVNAVHVAGYDRAGRTNNLFFEPPSVEENAAEHMAVDQTILNDVGRIAAAGQPDAPGDNRVANLLSGLEYQGTMEGGATFADFYGNEVGRVGIETQRANSAHESQTQIVDQLKNIRESISGVSLDEETTKMIEFQKAFEASARLVKTADEMLDTVLRLKQM